MQGVRVACDLIGALRRDLLSGERLCKYDVERAVTGGTQRVSYEMSEVGEF